MPMSDQEYASRVFFFTSIMAGLAGITFVAIGIAALVTDLLGTQLTVAAFSFAGLAFGTAGHLRWLRYRLQRDATLRNNPEAPSTNPARDDPGP
jgi:membrane protein implicated in regulation of membrane protease activity